MLMFSRKLATHSFFCRHSIHSSSDHPATTRTVMAVILIIASPWITRRLFAVMAADIPPDIPALTPEVTPVETPILLATVVINSVAKDQAIQGAVNVASELASVRILYSSVL